MVKPNPGESRGDFMGRCVPMMLDEGRAQDQAVAMCTSMYDQGNASVTITQEAEDRWLVDDGNEAGPHVCSSYEDAVRHLASFVSADTEQGLLPEEWTSPDGIAFSRMTAGGRDFTNTQWSWRDPNASLVPLMLQTKNLPAHMEAELAGFITQFGMNGPNPTARGRFYDSPIGRQARDMLLGGRKFGVSVGPSENIDYTASIECTEFGNDGECLAGQEVATFHTYEIANLTMEPTPCFEEASIVLDTGSDVPALMPVIASVNAPARPPAGWFHLPEPRPGVQFLDGTGDDYLIQQPGGSLACPLQIVDGMVFGHIASKGACHVGNPWGAGICAKPPDVSPTAYAMFHTGHVLCEGGEDVATGVLCVGPEHAPDRGPIYEVQGYYASAAHGWADVHVTDGEYGPWACGALRPGVTDEELRVLRSLSLSGDWRGVGSRGLDLIGVLAVNSPGLPIAREVIVAGAGMKIASPALRASSRNGEPTVLIAAGIVARCKDCARRASLEGQAQDRWNAENFPQTTALLAKLDRIEAGIHALDLRTRHLIPVEAQAVQATLGNGKHGV